LNAAFRIPRDERFIEVFSLADEYERAIRKVPAVSGASKKKIGKHRGRPEPEAVSGLPSSQLKAESGSNFEIEGSRSRR
jgi:hypothetical protein